MYRFFPLSDWTQILTMRIFHRACRNAAWKIAFFKLLTHHYIARTTLKHSGEIIQIFSQSFDKNFAKAIFTKNKKDMISQNISFAVRVNFSFFHIVKKVVFWTFQEWYDNGLQRHEIHTVPFGWACLLPHVDKL